MCWGVPTLFILLWLCAKGVVFHVDDKEKMGKDKKKKKKHFSKMFIHTLYNNPFYFCTFFIHTRSVGN